MKRIIIDFEDDIEPDRALYLVSRIVAKGRISEGPHGPQYCWLTQIGEEHVMTKTRRKDSKSDSFSVSKVR